MAGTYSAAQPTQSIYAGYSVPAATVDVARPMASQYVTIAQPVAFRAADYVTTAAAPVGTSSYKTYSPDYVTAVAAPVGTSSYQTYSAAAPTIAYAGTSVGQAGSYSAAAPSMTYSANGGSYSAAPPAVTYRAGADQASYSAALPQAVSFPTSQASIPTTTGVLPQQSIQASQAAQGYGYASELQQQYATMACAQQVQQAQAQVEQLQQQQMQLQQQQQQQAAVAAYEQQQQAVVAAYAQQQQYAAAAAAAYAQSYAGAYGMQPGMVPQAQSFASPVGGGFPGGHCGAAGGYPYPGYAAGYPGYGAYGGYSGYSPAYHGTAGVPHSPQGSKHPIQVKDKKKLVVAESPPSSQFLPMLSSLAVPVIGHGASRLSESGYRSLQGNCIEGFTVSLPKLAKPAEFCFDL
eukprot:CAMPEP_0203871942 /NCGR_PEP_ID=MMETSP0359-20131031/18993_1 /ASSEMBLY_ACC=CAM_ASM_000338 /TAXON_ID=268821 /ORGANISM="Scrippsiella Hangoei, Strain SHTV-5" /LENGTH=404 /DNA_ID=CAMNT_0050790623 /DNA_START=74 /DNA_END=1289 /DNA_ORIENTATION=-